MAPHGHDTCYRKRTKHPISKFLCGKGEATTHTSESIVLHGQRPGICLVGALKEPPTWTSVCARWMFSGACRGLGATAPFFGSIKNAELRQTETMNFFLRRRKELGRESKESTLLRNWWVGLGVWAGVGMHWMPRGQEEESGRDRLKVHETLRTSESRHVG